ncbi:MAG TPA: glycerophosphodiester phosphodiesterase [Candidatus Binataceae bacterium]|nr:glycerophosphodiester phosphodiesterase [Candidatus Binataceae bacterium]
MRRNLDSEFFLSTPPRIFAHRGDGGEFPENTLPSFEAAARLGAEYFELDVHMTRDGEVVVSHDGDLARACGRGGAIAAMTLGEVQSADAGYAFTIDGGASYPFRDRGIVVPRLADVLAAFSGTRFILEIKQTAPSLVPALLEVIDRAGMRAMVLIASEHQPPLDEVRALAPAMPTNFSYAEVAEFLQAMAARDGGYAPRGDALQIPPEYQGWKLVTPDSVAFARALGVEIHVWTVNDPAEMTALLDTGATGIITDFPARGLAVARSRMDAR